MLLEHCKGRPLMVAVAVGLRCTQVTRVNNLVVDRVIKWSPNRLEILDKNGSFQ